MEMFPQQDFINEKRYAYLHRKLNFLEKKNELKGIIEDVRNAQAVDPFNQTVFEDEEAYPEGVGIVEKQKETDNDLNVALNTALQKGLITTN